MNRVLLFLLLFLLWGCGGDTAGGTSSSENAKVMGYTFLAEQDSRAKTVLERVKIEIRTDDAVPGTETLVYETYSDTSGYYELTVPQNGSYTLYAYRDSFAVVQAKIQFDDSLLLFSPMLDRVAPMKMYLPYDSLQSGDSLFFAGTGIVKGVTIVGSDNEYQVVRLDNLPVGLFSSIGILGEMDETIAGEFQFSPIGTDTATMVIDITDSKPLWRFALAVGVKEEVAANFGGVEKFRDSLNVKYKKVSSLFDKEEFDGRYLFSVDSVFTFTGSYLDNAKGADPGYAYNIYYTNENVRGLIRTAYLYFGSTTYSFFKEWDKNLATKLLAEARGALDREKEEVSALAEPVVTNGYTPDASLMYDEMKSLEFTAFDVLCLNYNGDALGKEIDLLNSAVPSNLVLVITKNDMVIENATVKIYRSELDSKTVETTPYITANTDNTGRVSFAGSIYKDALQKIKYGNLLIHISHESDEKIAWLPLHEVGEVWFSSKTINFKKIDFFK